MNRTNILAFVVGLVLGGCSHDFHLMDQDGGPGSGAADAGVDAPPGALTLVEGGFSGDLLFVGSNGTALSGGFSTDHSVCPDTGTCVQGGLHP